MSGRDFALEVHEADEFDFGGAGGDLPEVAGSDAAEEVGHDVEHDSAPSEPASERLTVEVLTAFTSRASLEPIDIESRVVEVPGSVWPAFRPEGSATEALYLPAVASSADGQTARYLSGSEDGSGYNIEVLFLDDWPEQLKDAFVAAAEWLSDVILSDLPDAWLGGDLVDDVRIEARLSDIDGKGNILGRAEPYFARAVSGLPFAGEMEFDRADAENYDALGQFDDIVLHEMFHVLGFGTTWAYLDLTAGRVGDGDLRFTGPLASAFYAEEHGGVAGGVPLEEEGGPETASYHWDEAEFTLELMTGYIDNPNVVSKVTIASLEDIGYDTVLDDPASDTDLYGELPEARMA